MNAPYGLGERVDHERRMHAVEGIGLDEHGLPWGITTRREVRKADQFLCRRGEHRHPQADVVEQFAKRSRRGDGSAGNEVVTPGVYV
jgi:hypothetical protein